MRLKNLQLKDLGWTSFFESHFLELRQAELTPARVSEELKGFYRVRSQQGEYLAEIAGRVRYDAEEREYLPAVGDWVAVVARPAEGRARIECILPRKTKLSRKVAGRRLNEQIVAANLDTVFVVSSLNRELNLRRI
jgi:ribosome biogenesis GTPase